MNNFDENKAKQRLIIINAARLGGAILVAIGLGIIANGFMDLPKWSGYVLLGAGLFEFLVIPILLAKKWKTPKDL